MDLVVKKGRTVGGSRIDAGKGLVVCEQEDAKDVEVDGKQEKDLLGVIVDNSNTKEENFINNQT